MIVVVVPEPVDWLGRAIELARAMGHGSVEVLAPWALPGGIATSAIARRFGFIRRRQGPAGARVVAVPGWTAAEVGLAGWIGGRADRKLRAGFLRRDLVDRMAAAWLSRRRDVRVVIAPSLAAERTFAVAAARGVERVLIEDVAGLRQLQEDLDAAAEAHAGCRFLRRYRADHGVIARQEVEWVMADRLMVRGTFAREARIEAGVAELKIGEFENRNLNRRQATGDRRQATGDGRRVLLAGVAAARGGSVEALEMVEGSDCVLVVRVGEGTEPAELMRHPRVRRATAEEIERLEGIDVVIAPSWCESYPREVARARDLGVPVIGTRRAAGWVVLDREIEPGVIPSVAADEAPRRRSSSR